MIRHARPIGCPCAECVLERRLEAAGRILAGVVRGVAFVGVAVLAYVDVVLLITAGSVARR